MRKELEAHGLTRGWIVTEATWSAKLAEFGRQVGVMFARPDHFAPRQGRDDNMITAVGPVAPVADAPLGGRFTNRRPH